MNIKNEIFYIFLLSTIAIIGSSQSTSNLGIQLSSDVLLFSNIGHYQEFKNPQIQPGYRLAIFHTSTKKNKKQKLSRISHTWQISYSHEKIFYEGVTNPGDYEINYTAIHIGYYFGFSPKRSKPLNLSIGHNLGTIITNNGDWAESDLFGLLFKVDYDFTYSNSLYFSPFVEYALTYNKSSVYNNKINFGLNVALKFNNE